jgi:hypothetical protein
MNWLKIENREFNGKKWEGRGWESKKIFFYNPCAGTVDYRTTGILGY